ncbi:MAG TPA: energy transducer TonB [Candidatus Acidoferrales bacterium]|nr:energy transducer TonB [Candidatus Acidoferrales bacterium]
MDENRQRNLPSQNAQTDGAPGLDLKLTRLAVSRESWFSLFLSNIKEFLTERPVKVPRGAASSAFQPARFGSSMSDNFKELLRRLPASARQASDSELLVTSKGWFATFWENIRDTVAPRKLPPLKVTSKPIDVPEIWTPNKQFTKVQALSLAFHVLVIVLVILPLLPEFMSPPIQANSTTVTPLNVSPYLAKLKMGNKKAGGGGGRTGAAPATRGRLPKFSMDQLTPPEVKPPEHAKLQVEPTVMAPPNIHMPTPNLPNNGDPLSSLVNDSMGNGSGTGIGNGSGGGVGPGSQYGIGGGTPNAGENGYGTPICLYCPNPKYSDAGFKLKIQGVVVLDVVIGTDGRAHNIHVSKGLGYGLDEEAITAVRDIYRFKPSTGPDGRPAAVHMLFEIEFRLY